MGGQKRPPLTPPVNKTAVAVERTISNALSFNEIKSFEEQEKEVDKAALKAIADIFVRHSMHTKLGAGLLHRHDALEDGTALSSIDMDKITPNSWFLNQNGLFQAFDGRGTISVSLRLISEQNIETSEPVITGRSFHVNEMGVVECKGNNVCRPMNSGNHKVLQDSKPYTEHVSKVMPLVDVAEEES
ncbi:predicted protein [Histoplasma capsulatum G186AR]|uniref:Uncharacterized protein n=1 Tax=Ajellomyces capsulatus (strain G186AR / H82 / ATCC MYA-2454 / RMSCC 2432) TaxID=447093 RepID=C0P0G4_AJECG|nr:uncharacterized protein HCBG_08894 [Histoplasma capsulatum G186AR]EEH02784.1 predicted protein [Histoplasma capsulatum G186AR]